MLADPVPVGLTVRAVHLADGDAQPDRQVVLGRLALSSQLLRDPPGHEVRFRGQRAVTPECEGGRVLGRFVHEGIIGRRQGASASVRVPRHVLEGRPARNRPLRRDLQRLVDGVSCRQRHLRFHGSSDSRGQHSRPHYRHGPRLGGRGRLHPRSGRRPANAWRRHRHGRRRGRFCSCCGVHRDGAPRLVFQHGPQDGPAGVENDPVEPGLGPDMAARLLDRAPGAARHVPHPEVLDDDGMPAPAPEPGGHAGNLARDLVAPVAPHAGNALARLRQPDPGALPAPGAALLARQPPGQALRTGLQTLRVRGRFPDRFRKRAES